MHDLSGVTVLDKAKFDEAETLLTGAIEIERKLFPDGNKDVAFALFGLGELYVRKADYNKARPLLDESVSIYDKLLGANNMDSAAVLVSLARTQAFTGDLAGAEATYRQSVAIYRQLPSRYEIRLATALLNLGLLQVTKRNFDEGISTMLEAEAIFFRKQGESFTSFEAKAYLCRAYFSKSDYDQTIVEGQKAIEMGRRLKLEDAQDFIVSLEYVGLAATRNGKAKEGEPTLRESLDRVRKTWPSEVPFAIAALSECLTTQKRFAEAEPLMTENFEVLRSTLGPDNPRTAASKDRLIKLYNDWKKPELAAKYGALTGAQ